MELDQLRTFLAVLSHGSFSRAATALRIGQSTVSFHVKALEVAAGARLLDRRGTVRPTPAGRVLRRYALKLVQLRDEALLRVRDEEAGQAGRVTLAASTIPGEYLLPPVLAAFRRAHPKVALRVEVSDSRAAYDALLAQDCDLALVGAPLKDPRVVATPFADDEIVLVGATRSTQLPKRLTRAQLREVPLIVRGEGSGTHDAVGALLGDGAAQLQVSSAEAAKRCVLAGLGLAFLSRRAVAEELSEGRLQVVALPGTPVKRRFYALRLRSITPPAAARALVEALVQKYR